MIHSFACKETEDLFNCKSSRRFKNIERIYPLSNEAIQSQIMLGFINYILLDYDTAILQFSRIINKYPSFLNECNGFGFPLLNLRFAFRYP